MEQCLEEMAALPLCITITLTLAQRPCWPGVFLQQRFTVRFSTSKLLRFQNFVPHQLRSLWRSGWITYWREDSHVAPSASEPGLATYGPVVCNERCGKRPGVLTIWSSPDVTLHDSQMSCHWRCGRWWKDTNWLVDTEDIHDTHTLLSRSSGLVVRWGIWQTNVSMELC